MSEPTFDLERALRESPLARDLLEATLQEVREEFPDDEVMYELHAIRALDADLRLHFGTERWSQSRTQRIARMLKEHGLERRVVPPGSVARLLRKPVPESSTG